MFDEYDYQRLMGDRGSEGCGCIIIVLIIIAAIIYYFKKIDHFKFVQYTIKCITMSVPSTSTAPDFTRLLDGKASYKIVNPYYERDVSPLPDKQLKE